MSSPASRAITAAPVTVSPLRIDHSTGAAPRQRGSSEKWRFTIGHGVEDVGLDQPAEGHHHAELGAGVDHVVDPVRHGQAEVEGCGLHRAGHEGAAPSTAAVGLADHQDDIVARLDQRPQRADGHLGRAQVGEPQGNRPA